MLSNPKIYLEKFAVFHQTRRSFARSGGISASSHLPAEKPSGARHLAERNELPIEKQSLTRGLSLNKFEKDFLIFPEYSETEEVEQIKKYVRKVGTDFEEALVGTGDAKDALPTQIVYALVKNEVFKSLIPKDFGGYQFCQKDLLLLTESLSKDDLSIFTVFNQIQSAVALISVFGTPEQKKKYLSRIAEYKCRPCICVEDEQTVDSIETEVVRAPGEKHFRLNGVKTNVISADSADIFIVFGKQKVGDIEAKRCFIVDKEDLGGGAVDIQERIFTQGLNAVHYSKVRFTNVLVTENNRLGADEPTEDLLNELAVNGKTFYGAAVVGSLKKLIMQLCDFANSRMEGNLRLSDTHAVQTALSELAVGVYVLESMVYYIGGLCDERLFLLNDLENSIIQRFANKVLRKAILAICDVAGLTAANAEFPFDKMIRDIVTLISSSESDLKLVRRISLPALEAYIQQHGNLSKLAYLKFPHSETVSVVNYARWLATVIKSANTSGDKRIFTTGKSHQKLVFMWESRQPTTVSGW